MTKARPTRLRGKPTEYPLNGSHEAQRRQARSVPVLQIAELERQADEHGGQAKPAQLADLRRQHAKLLGMQERAAGLSQRLMAEINTFRAGKEATKSAYTAAEPMAKTLAPR
jgi:hypothetical protein